MVFATPQASRIKIVQLSSVGYKTKRIAQIVKVNERTVRRILKKVREKGSISCDKRPGRKRKLTMSDERQIVIHAKFHPSASFKEIIDDLHLDVSTNTISRVLKRHGLKSYVARKKPCISKKNCALRLKFAKEYVSKDDDFWKNVIWTDESRFCLRSDNRKANIIRSVGEALNSRNTVKTFKHSSSIMVWGSFSFHGVGNLAEIDGKMDAVKFVNILEQNVIDSVAKMNMRRNFVLQMDNDPKHTSKRARQTCQKHHWNLLPHPPQSPDLNPIEHLWDELDRRVKKPDRINLGIFRSKLFEEWEKLPKSVLEKLVNSLKRRLQAVIQAKGMNTRY